MEVMRLSGRICWSLATMAALWKPSSWTWAEWLTKTSSTPRRTLPGWDEPRTDSGAASCHADANAADPCSRSYPARAMSRDITLPMASGSDEA